MAENFKVGNFVPAIMPLIPLAWSKSLELVEQKKAFSKEIVVNYAWRKLHIGTQVKFFSYYAPNFIEIAKLGYNVAGRYKVNYPFNLHINPKIYLYENTQAD